MLTWRALLVVGAQGGRAEEDADVAARDGGTESVDRHGRAASCAGLPGCRVGNLVHEVQRGQGGPLVHDARSNSVCCGSDGVVERLLGDAHHDWNVLECPFRASPKANQHLASSRDVHLVVGAQFDVADHGAIFAKLPEACLPGPIPVINLNDSVLPRHARVFGL